MNALLHIDDDLASYLSEQAQREQTTLDVLLNRLLRLAVTPQKPTVQPNLPPVSLERDANTDRMVLTRHPSLPPITTEMVTEILNEQP